MLIKLSSDNEPDPTKFANNFSEGMVIKPFSKVALIKGQITRIDQGKKVKIAAGTILNVRYTPYDLIQLVLNPLAETTYTLDAFCAYVHTLLPNGTAWNRGAKFMNVSGQGGVADLEWVFYWTVATAPHFETFMYGHEHYKRQYLSAVNGKNMPSVGGSGGNTPQIGGDGGDWAVGVAWNPAVYTVPPNQANGNAHNMLISGQGEGRTEFIIGQPDLRNLKVSFGNATHDGVNYTSGAIVGTPGYDDPGGTLGNMLLNLNFKATGKLDIQYFNHTNNAMEMVYTNEVYNPGDIFNIHGVGSPRFPDPTRYFTMNVNVKRSNGLAYWIPGITSLAGTDTQMTLNIPSGTPLPIALDAFYITHLDKPVAQSTARFGALNMDTEWTATGYRFIAGFSLDISGEADANSQVIVSGGGELISDGVDEVVEGLTGEPNAWLNGAFFLERWTAGAVAGVQSDKNAVCSIATNGIPLTTPFYIGFFFQPADDTAKISAGNNNMTLLGAVATAAHDQLVQITIAQAETWDLRFREADASERQVALLLNGTGARINIALAGNYHFSMCYMGTGVAPGAGIGQIIFRIYDIDNDLLYHNIPAATSIGLTGLPPLSYWGGLIPTVAAGFGKWSCAYYADFRLYEKCSDTTGHTVNLWDNIQTELQTYWGTGVKTAEWFWGETPIEVIIPTPAMSDAAGYAEPQYIIAGLPRPETTITQIYQRPIAANSVDTEWYDIINAYSPGATHLPNGNRLTTLDAPSYAGNQCGLVETTDIADELDFIDPTADGNANVLKSRSNVSTGTGETHPYATFEIDLEDTVLQRETINIELTNLPHRTYNGTNGSVDKTIYQMPLVNHSTAIDNLEILEVIPPSKVWLELNNPGEIPLNRLEIQLSDSSGKKLNELNYSQPTNIVVEIKNKEDIIN